MKRAGFRSDWAFNGRDRLSVQGTIYDGRSEQTVGYVENLTSSVAFRSDSEEVSGNSILLNWGRELSDKAALKVYTYFDQAKRKGLILDQEINTFDIEFQHRYRFRENQELTWGGGYRLIKDDIRGGFTVSFEPAKETSELYNIYLQDQISLSDELRVILGSKFEYGTYTHTEIQPSARLIWLLSPQHTLWGAVSRAVRTPARVERGVRINYLTLTSSSDLDGEFGPLEAGDRVLFSNFGSRQFDSEHLTSIEMGYRGQPDNKVSLDVALFYNDYNNLRSSERSFTVESDPAPLHALIADVNENNLEAKSYGLELASNWQLNSRWRLAANYTFLKINAKLKQHSTDSERPRQWEEGSPNHQAMISSSWDMKKNINVDLALYYVDQVSTSSIGRTITIPAYTRLDARLAWRPKKGMELSFAAQNITDRLHTEYSATDVVSSQIPRSFYAQVKLTWP